MSNRKWIITWDAGFGIGYEVVEAISKDDARLAAFERAQEEFSANVMYGAEPYSKEAAQDYEIE